MNIDQLLGNRAALTPHKEAIVTANRRLTFLELHQQVQQFAQYLSAEGVAKSDRVAICSKNSEFLVVAFLATVKIGAISVILNWRLQTHELNYILNDSAATHLLYEQEFDANVAELKLTHPALKLISDDDYAHMKVSISAADQALTPVLASDLALILYTSGTTGKPKGACISHQAIIASAQANCFALEWDFSHRFLLVAPIFHVGGLSPLMSNLLQGCTTILVADFDPIKVWQRIEQEKVNSLMTVPIMLQALITVAEQVEVDASSLVSVTCGASVVSESLIQRCLHLGLSVQQVYGITEFSGAVSFWTKHMGIESLKTHGKPTFFAEVKVVDPQSQHILPNGQDGEIYCRGPMQFSGYWNNPEATQAALVEGWYRTGDIGHINAEGFLLVVDRLKDMIISGGENVYPAEIEAVLATHPAVQELAVVGQVDHKWGEIPVAWVVRKQQEKLDESELIDFCLERLAKYKCIKEVKFIDSLPRNSAGKVLKRELKTTLS